jgi:hypothetical protein
MVREQESVVGVKRAVSLRSDAKAFQSFRDAKRSMQNSSNLRRSPRTSSQLPLPELQRYDVNERPKQLCQNATRHILSKCACSNAIQER